MSRMPRQTATERLTALIAALPAEPAMDILAKTIAADLVALLPKTNGFNVRSPDSVFAAIGPQQTQVRMAVGALAIVIAIVFALSANLSPGSGHGAKPSAPPAGGATTALPRKLDP
jgi:hypothetical protein